MSGREATGGYAAGTPWYATEVVLAVVCPDNPRDNTQTALREVRHNEPQSIGRQSVKGLASGKTIFC